MEHAILEGIKDELLTPALSNGLSDGNALTSFTVGLASSLFSSLMQAVCTHGSTRASIRAVNMISASRLAILEGGL